MDFSGLLIGLIPDLIEFINEILWVILFANIWNII